MQLILDKEKCENCSGKNCLKECPQKIELSGFNCKHCLPEKANCFNACAFGAIEEIASGVLGVNLEKCKGCGKCAKACEREGIVLVKGKAKKCDLCADREFEMQCVKVCAEKAIEVKEGIVEVRGVERALGWRVFYITGGGGILREDEDRKIHFVGKEKFYSLKGVPQFTLQEALLLKKALGEFQVKDEKKKNLFGFFQKFLERKGIELNELQEKYFLDVLKSCIKGFGVLDYFLKDDELEEVCLIGLGKEKPLRVYHRTFGWLKSNAYFSSEEVAREIVNKMARVSGRRLSLKTPSLNAVLPNGSRLQASIKPIAFSGVNFTIRKFKAKPFTPLELLGNETVCSRVLAFLWLALQGDLSVVICGNTGSGKTSTLNALFSFVSASERVIVVEETPELVVPQEHLVKLNTCDEVQMGELITETLRMRPDRVVVGEVRSSGEVKAFVDTMLAGQGKGSFTSFHAVSALECVNRLKNLGAGEQDLNALDLVLVQKRWDEINLKEGVKREVRKLVQVCEIDGGRVRELFGFDFKKRKWVVKGESKKVFSKLEKNFSLSRKELGKEILRREKLLEKLALKEFSLDEFFSFVNKFEENKNFREEIYEEYFIK